MSRRAYGKPLGYSLNDAVQHRKGQEQGLETCLFGSFHESCDLLLNQDYKAQCLTLVCEMQEGSLHLALSAARCGNQQAENPADAGMAKLIIGSLGKKVDLEQDENGVHTVRMILPAKV